MAYQGGVLGIHHDNFLQADGGHQTILGEKGAAFAAAVQGPPLQDVPLGVPGKDLLQGPPGAHVVPTHIHRHHGYPGGMLHNTVI